MKDTVYRVVTSKERAESVPIEKALDLIKKLGITKQEYAMIFCGLSSGRQLSNWIKRGRMPANRFWASQNELAKCLTKKYNEDLKVIWGENEDA